MLRRRKMLGLAVTSRCITAIEVVAANGGGRARRAAVFNFPDAAGLRDPAALGKALRQFLGEQGFSGSRCVIGMEASWLTARDKPLPPSAGESVAKILALMVEREFASDRKELVFDYSLTDGQADRPSALLVAAPQSALDQLTAMAAAAGLAVSGITASTLALAGVTDGPADREQLILHLFGGGAELALRTRGGIGMMRRLPVQVPPGTAGEELWGGGRLLGELADELRRVVALLPGGGPAGAAARELLVWDETGLRPGDREALSRQLGLTVNVCERPEGLQPPAASPAPGAQFSAAAAMALAAVRGRPLIIDLLHSRLSPARRLGVGRRAAWAAAVAAALLVAGAVVALDWRRDRLEAARMTARLGAMAGDLAEARGVIDKVTFARPWYDRRQSYLDCMREITLAFPQEGLIWTTSLAVQEDMQVVLSGKAVSESAVLDVLDRLKASPKLTQVKPLYLRQASRQGREIAFAMSFTFTPTGKTWSSPDAKKPSSRRR